MLMVLFSLTRYLLIKTKSHLPNIHYLVNNISQLMYNCWPFAKTSFMSLISHPDFFSSSTMLVGFYFLVKAILLKPIGANLRLSRLPKRTVPWFLLYQQRECLICVGLISSLKNLILKKMIHNFHIDVFINLNIHKFDARHLFF